MTARTKDRMAAQQHSCAFDAQASEFFTSAITDPVEPSVEEANQFAGLMTEILGATAFFKQQCDSGTVDEQNWLRR